jgi:hypothetical protein
LRGADLHAPRFGGAAPSFYSEAEPKKGKQVMVDAAQRFKSAQKRLAKLNCTIDELQEQWLISALINPLTFKQRELEQEREPQGLRCSIWRDNSTL